MKNIQKKLRIYYTILLIVAIFILALVAGYFGYQYFAVKDFLFLFLSVISLLSIALAHFLLYPIQALGEVLGQLDKLETLVKDIPQPSKFSETVGKALQEYIEPITDLYEEKDVKFEEPDEVLSHTEAVISEVEDILDNNPKDEVVDEVVESSIRNEVIQEEVIPEVIEEIVEEPIQEPTTEEKSDVVAEVEDAVKDLQATIEKSIEQFNQLNSIEVKPFNHNEKLRELISNYLLNNDVPEKFIKDLVDNIYELKFYKDKVQVSTSYSGRNSTFAVNYNLNDLQIKSQDAIVRAVDGFENIKSVSASKKMFE